MTIRPDDILSMTDFKRRTAACLKKMKKTGRASVLTVNGRATAVVMDPAAYNELMDSMDRAEAVDAVRRSMREFEQGRGVPARQALERARHRRKSA